MKYKVGDKVQLKEGTDFKHGRGGVGYKEVGIIRKLYEDDVTISFPSCYNWYGLTSEIILAEEIEVGDTVRIRKNITLEELPKNHWNGRLSWTMDFLRRRASDDFDGEYIVTKVEERGLGLKGYDIYPSKDIFELVKKKEVKEMTIEEISEALGYEVKVVKGGK